MKKILESLRVQNKEIRESSKKAIKYMFKDYLFKHTFKSTYEIFLEFYRCFSLRTEIIIPNQFICTNDKTNLILKRKLRKITKLYGFLS